MNISILTATWHYNLWDELILLQEYKILKERYKDSRFFVFTYDKKSSLIEDEIDYIQYFPSWIKKNPLKNIWYFWQNIKAIYKSDLVIIWWWWLIYEEEVQSSSSPILQWKLRIFLAKLFRKKIIYFWIGINVKKPANIKYLFSWKRTFVSVRDEKSSRALETIWIKNILMNDPVFLLEPEKKIHTENTKIIWISLRKWYLKNEKENIKQIVLYLSRLWYKLVFLSHSIHKEDILANDYEFLSDIARKYNIEITRTIKDTLSYYKKLDFVIWMRLHSLIISLVYNIPFLALSYSQKTDELLKGFNYDFIINPKEFIFTDFIKSFEDLEKNASKFDFKGKISTIKSDLNLNINKIIKYGLE